MESVEVKVASSFLSRAVPYYTFLLMCHDIPSTPRRSLLSPPLLGHQGELAIKGRELQYTKAWTLPFSANEMLFAKLRLKAGIDLINFRSFVRIGFRTEQVSGRLAVGPSSRAEKGFEILGIGRAVANAAAAKARTTSFKWKEGGTISLVSIETRFAGVGGGREFDGRLSAHVHFQSAHQQRLQRGPPVKTAGVHTLRSGACYKRAEAH